jgi:hypothetical protein
MILLVNGHFNTSLNVRLKSSSTIAFPVPFHLTSSTSSSSVSVISSSKFNNIGFIKLQLPCYFKSSLRADMFPFMMLCESEGSVAFLPEPSGSPELLTSVLRLGPVILSL